MGKGKKKTGKKAMKLAKKRKAEAAAAAAAKDGAEPNGKRTPFISGEEEIVAKKKTPANQKPHLKPYPDAIAWAKSQGFPEKLRYAGAAHYNGKVTEVKQMLEGQPALKVQCVPLQFTVSREEATGVLAALNTPEVNDFIFGASGGGDVCFGVSESNGEAAFMDTVPRLREYMGVAANTYDKGMVMNSEPTRTDLKAAVKERINFYKKAASSRKKAIAAGLVEETPVPVNGEPVAKMPWQWKRADVRAEMEREWQDRSSRGIFSYPNIKGFNQVTFAHSVSSLDFHVPALPWAPLDEEDPEFEDEMEIHVDAYVMAPDQKVLMQCCKVLDAIEENPPKALEGGKLEETMPKMHRLQFTRSPTPLPPTNPRSALSGFKAAGVVAYRFLEEPLTISEVFQGSAEECSTRPIPTPPPSPVPTSAVITKALPHVTHAVPPTTEVVAPATESGTPETPAQASETFDSAEAAVVEEVGSSEAVSPPVAPVAPRRNRPTNKRFKSPKRSLRPNLHGPNVWGELMCGDLGLFPGMRADLPDSSTSETDTSASSSESEPELLPVEGDIPDGGEQPMVPAWPRKPKKTRRVKKAPTGLKHAATAGDLGKIQILLAEEYRRSEEMSTLHTIGGKVDEKDLGCGILTGIREFQEETGFLLADSTLAAMTRWVLWHPRSRAIPVPMGKYVLFTYDLSRHDSDLDSRFNSYLADDPVVKEKVEGEEGVDVVKVPSMFFPTVSGIPKPPECDTSGLKWVSLAECMALAESRSPLMSKFSAIMVNSRFLGEYLVEEMMLAKSVKK